MRTAPAATNLALDPVQPRHADRRSGCMLLLCRGCVADWVRRCTAVDGSLCCLLCRGAMRALPAAADELGIDRLLLRTIEALPSVCELCDFAGDSAADVHSHHLTACPEFRLKALLHAHQDARCNCDRRPGGCAVGERLAALFAEPGNAAAAAAAGGGRWDAPVREWMLAQRRVRPVAALHALAPGLCASAVLRGVWVAALRAAMVELPLSLAELEAAAELVLRPAALPADDPVCSLLAAALHVHWFAPHTDDGADLRMLHECVVQCIVLLPRHWQQVLAAVTTPGVHAGPGCLQLFLRVLESSRGRPKYGVGWGNANTPPPP